MYLLEHVVDTVKQVHVIFIMDILFKDVRFDNPENFPHTIVRTNKGILFKDPYFKDPTDYIYEISKNYK